LWSRVTEGYGALPAFGLINRLQVGDTGPVELALAEQFARAWVSFFWALGTNVQ
jgi:hypothetical protein